MKKCSKCSIEKPLTEFYKHKTTKDGLNSQCKTCTLNKTKEKFSKNPLYMKQWYVNNKDKEIDKAKLWQQNNIERHKQNNKNYNYKKSGIYEWYDGEVCLYVGQSKALNGRINLHKSLFRNPHTSKKQDLAELYEALRQHQNAQIHIIEECPPEVLLEREQYYIDTKKPLYNRNKI